MADANPFNLNSVKVNMKKSDMNRLLTKNVDLRSQDPKVIDVNNFITERVNTFLNEVVDEIPDFDCNKLEWYFEIYKEGLEIHKFLNNNHPMIQITGQNIRSITEYFAGKTIEEYLALGLNYLTTVYSVLSTFIRNELINHRAATIYLTNNPVEWIKTAVSEERGEMSKKPEELEDVINVVSNIGLIISRRV